MIVRFKKDYLLLAFDLWWLVFVVLVNTGFNALQILNIVGFISLVFVPGLLTVLALKLRGLHLWGYVVLIVALSILELICFGLIGNAFLPLIGILQPLENPYLLGTISVGVVGLAFIAWTRASDVVLDITIAKFSLHNVIMAWAPVLLIALSVVGAIILNNGGNAAVTLAMLLATALYLWQLLRYSESLSSTTVATGLYGMSLSLLLMTSLRGWSITGHDIQREFLVFQLTTQHGMWAINYLKDAYNACMSITILPVIFSKMLSIADPYVYKVVFQMLFATIPPLLYLMVRRYFSAPLAIVASIYFVAFPTFFGDMPFLNRQEIAFIFLVTMFYILFEETVSLAMRRALFVVLGIGMVLSHYSTTYTVLGGLVLVLLGQWLILKLMPLFTRRGYLHNSSFEGVASPYHRRIMPWMILLLMAVSFLWSSVLTDTSSNSLYRVISQTFAVIAANSKQDAQSADVLYGLFSWHSVDPQQQLALYEKNYVKTIRAQAEPGTFINEKVAERFPITLVKHQTVPLTMLGTIFSSLGIDIQSFNYIFKQVTAKLLQIFILIGFIAALVSQRWVRERLSAEYWLMGAASIIMLLAIVILPVLSVEYGLLRAFLQSLMFLSVFVVIGSIAFIKRQDLAVKTAGLIAIIFFLSSTGFFTQLTGGYDAQLHLSNSGVYYDNFYAHNTDLAALSWLGLEMKAKQDMGYFPQLQTDSYVANAQPDLLPYPVAFGIYPKLLETNAYVFLGYNNVHNAHATIVYNSDQLAYNYPLQFLDENKDLLYDNGNARIYR